MYKNSHTLTVSGNGGKSCEREGIERERERGERERKSGREKEMFVGEKKWKKEEDKSKT